MVKGFDLLPMLSMGQNQGGRGYSFEAITLRGLISKIIFDVTLPAVRVKVINLLEFYSFLLIYVPLFRGYPVPPYAQLWFFFQRILLMVILFFWDIRILGKQVSVCGIVLINKYLD